MATTVFLIILMVFNSGYTRRYTHQMPAWDVCRQAVSVAVVDVSDGAENEATVVVYCAYDKP